MFDYIFMAAAVIIIIIALRYFISLHHKKEPVAKISENHAFVNCPLCGSPLVKGENIVTRVWRPMSVPEQRITISGCPHCFPVCRPGVKRICPVCHTSVPVSGYLVAHLFNMPEGKKHVVITGCSHCCEHEKKY